MGSPGVNFDRRRTHNLTVQVQSNRSDCQRARIRINIRVIRNRIDFGQLERQTVEEMTPVGTNVVCVVASGGAGVIRYTIASGNPDSGMVTIFGVLDHETRPTYNLTVRADGVGTTVTGETDLIIDVTDLNEPHVFTTPCALTAGGCSFIIRENDTSANVLIDFDLTDPDSPSSPNGTLSFELSNAVVIPFSVDANGVLRVTRQLDREARDFYSFRVIVRDECLPSSCQYMAETTVRVTIMDENDNPPIFTLMNPSTSEPSKGEIMVNGFICFTLHFR